MSHLNRFLAVLVCFAFAAALAASSTRLSADPTSQPAGQTGSIIVTVVDSGNAPVASADVMLKAKGSKKTQQDAGDQPATPAAVMSGVTDANGTFTFTNIPLGRYVVTARLRKVGRGRGTVELLESADGSPTAKVTVTLQPKGGGPGGGGGGAGGGAGNPTSMPSNNPN